MAKNIAPEDKPSKNRLGETLFDPREKGKVDIVFVHGPGGDRIGTWTWKDEHRSEFWPKSFLPKDCPTARIISFGYNADFAHFYPPKRKSIAPELTIDDYSTSLLQALVTLRGTETNTRLVIFVAHSLGGLVVANALSQPHGTDEAAKQVVDYTIGTLFLGTPFEGSNKVKYGRIAIELLKYFLPTQKGNLNDLEEQSEKLVSISNAFARFLKERDRSQAKPCLEVACFYEERSLYKHQVRIGLIVPKESASWLGVNPISIPRDHVAMCKFLDKEGSDYKSVAEKLRQWIADIEKPRPAGRGASGRSDGREYRRYSFGIRRI